MRDELALVIIEYETGEVGVQAVATNADGEESFDNCHKEEKGRKPRMTLVKLRYPDPEGVIVEAKTKILSGLVQKFEKSN